MSSNLFVFLALCLIVAVQIEAVYVEPCNEVCGRSHPERMECCRAHGFWRGMSRGQCFGGRAYCRGGHDSSTSEEW